MLLECLLDIEQKIKTAMSNLISSKYGVKDNIYLRKNNFDVSSKHLENTIKVIKNQRKIYGERNIAVKHYKSTYGYIPFYVLSKCITFGAVKKLFNVMKQIDQDFISNEILFRTIKSKRITKTKLIIALIADVRNMCAHDEILFNFVHKSIDIGIFKEHSYFSFKKNEKGNLIQGRKDLFALLLCMKYVMNRTDYNKLIQRLDSIINKISNKSNVFDYNELIEYMNLPNDWIKIKQI